MIRLLLKRQMAIVIGIVFLLCTIYVVNIAFSKPRHPISITRQSSIRNLLVLAKLYQSENDGSWPSSISALCETTVLKNVPIDIRDIDDGDLKSSSLDLSTFISKNYEYLAPPKDNRNDSSLFILFLEKTCDANGSRLAIDRKGDLLIVRSFSQN